MKTPARLHNLMAEGLIDSVVRQLKSGKEADVYVVRCGADVKRGRDATPVPPSLGANPANRCNFAGIVSRVKLPTGESLS